MASKHRCTSCKCYFPKESMIVVTAGKFHDQECLKEYGMKSTDKVLSSAKKKERSDDVKAKKSQLKTRKTAAKKVCHDYIRARDSGRPCICCGKPLGSNFHAGHWLNSGNNPQVRYNENNIHGQRLDCNFFKGGDSGEYRCNLTNKIGLVEVNKLLNLKGGTMKRTAEDYRTIEVYYKSKLKRLISGQ